MSPPRISASTWIALTTLTFSWFWLNTLVSHFGPVQQDVHFYDLGTVLLNPFWLIHGIARWHTLEAFAFGLLSAVVLLAPLAAHRLPARSAWLLYAGPLGFMLLCGVVLYVKTSGPYVTASPVAGPVVAFLARIANDAVSKVTDTIARHISIGAGGYLSFLAAVYLTFTGVREYVARARAQSPQGISEG